MRDPMRISLARANLFPHHFKIISPITLIRIFKNIFLIINPGIFHYPSCFADGILQRAVRENLPSNHPHYAR